MIERENLEDSNTGIQERKKRRKLEDRKTICKGKRRQKYTKIGRQKDWKTHLPLDLSEQAAHAGEALGLRVDGVALLEGSQTCEAGGGDDHDAEDNGEIYDHEDSDEIDDDTESVYSSLLSGQKRN